MIERRCSFFVVSTGKPSREIEAHLVAEQAQRAGARAVVLARAAVADRPQEVEILPHACAAV